MPSATKLFLFAVSSQKVDFMKKNEIEKEMMKYLELEKLPKVISAFIPYILESFLYDVNRADIMQICLSISKIKREIFNYCNITTLPDETSLHFSYMVVGDFLQTKKAQGLLVLEGLNLEQAIKSITEGDVSVTFDSSSSDSEKFDTLIDGMCELKGGVFDCYRRLKW